MTVLRLEAGDHTEELLIYITGELDDAILDTIEIERENERSEKLATEPLTVAATLTLATTTVIVVGRLIEKWLENRRQRDQLRIVVDGFNQSDAAGEALSDISKKYADVSISYGLLNLPKKKDGKA